MKTFLAFLLAFLALPALADDMLASSGQDNVRLTKSACAPAILEKIGEQLRPHFLGAVAMVNGVQFKPCWALRPDGMVELRYEDGDRGMIPLQDFKRVPGA
jgi:hypothetical protein